ncbi:hypothetical protein CVS40_8897 [Lucilia cuprina]|nr:hypothetical protein CVS40_8897 [Lucilia cuprina]
MCVVNAVDAANIYVFNSQKNFANQMDVASCSSKANIKKALDCSYLVEKEAISAISESKTLIDKCLTGQNDANHVPRIYMLRSFYMQRYEVSYSSKHG